MKRNTWRYCHCLPFLKILEKSIQSYLRYSADKKGGSVKKEKNKDRKKERKGRKTLQSLKFKLKISIKLLNILNNAIHV